MTTRDDEPTIRVESDMKDMVRFERFRWYDTEAFLRGKWRKVTTSADMEYAERRTAKYAAKHPDEQVRIREVVR